eukprot:4611211-Karenia_brevis.AAC.1
MRVGGRWKRHATRRGGYQGLRLVTVLFCCSLRRSLRRGIQHGVRLAKPKYQDDNYMVGHLKDMASTWS